MNVYRLPSESPLYLVRQLVPAAKAVAKPKNQNLIAVLDCSGSMAGDLHRVGTQLKNKISTLLEPGDTVTVVWFSGKGDCGVVLEFMGVQHLKDLQRIHDAIDKWLRPVGLTGFVEPLEKVQALVLKYDNGNPWHMLFMSDGMDNQWPREAVLQSLEAAASVVAGVTIVEYGYYADRSFLAKMAEKAGGTHVVARDFDGFMPALEKSFKDKPLGAKRITARVECTDEGGFVWTLDTERHEVSTYAINDKGEVELPEGTREVWHLSPGSWRPVARTGAKSKVAFPDIVETGLGFAPPTDAWVAAAYAGMGLFALRAKPKHVGALLRASGDVHLIRQFGNTFGKQAYTSFYESVMLAAFDGEFRLGMGYNPAAVVDKNAWSVLDTLVLLASSDKNRILLDDPNFQYTKISRAKIAEEGSLEFKANAWTGPAGYSVDRLVFNESRPNLSIGVEKVGNVHLPANRPEEIPLVLETKIQRNYNIFKDGLLHVAKLPVLVTGPVLETLGNRGALSQSTRASTQDIDGEPVFELLLELDKLPVVNRAAVEECEDVSALAARHYETHKARAYQKVYGYYYEEYAVKGAGFTRTSEGLAKKYGDDAAAWLKERGLTDHGFSPRSHVALVKDYYVGTELHVGVAGLSSLPPVKDVLERIAKDDAAIKAGKKLKLAPISHRLMRSAIFQVQECEKQNTINAVRRNDVIRGWIDAQAVIWRQKTRELIRSNARSAVSILMGQTWFGRDDFGAIEHTLNTPEGDIVCTVELRDVKIDI